MALQFSGGSMHLLFGDLKVASMRDATSKRVIPFMLREGFR